MTKFILILYLVGLSDGPVVKMVPHEHSQHDTLEECAAEAERMVFGNPDEVLGGVCVERRLSDGLLNSEGYQTSYN